MLGVVPTGGGGDRMGTLIARRWEDFESDTQRDPPLVATTITCRPQPHGIIRNVPHTLSELHDFTAIACTDLLATLRGRYKRWLLELPGQFRSIQNARLILIIRLPKTRGPTGCIEATELRAFLALDTVMCIGQEIGVLGITDERPGLLVQFDETKKGTEIRLAVLNPRMAFSSSLAAQSSGFDGAEPIKIVAIGVGALGSQVVVNLIRAGFGQWTLVDHDVLFPHNLARHALHGLAVGLPKAEALAQMVNDTIDGTAVARAIVTNVLHPGEQSELLSASLQESDVILDMSTSIPVERHLCGDVEALARRVSLFLNPTGTALTLLAEDPRRQIPLDMLEMQFYRELVIKPELCEMHRPGAGQVRIGQSCRDVSVQIPQDLVALHAAVGSRALREAIRSEKATISVWRADERDLSIVAIHVEPSKVKAERIGDWTVCTDAKLTERLACLRSEKLPNETGGVLIGAHDLQRRIVYVVDTVPSPPDSEEWPTLYIRGSQGLGRRVREIGEATGGMLRYVGEWHSHPDGHGVSPSSDDKKVQDWLKNEMGQAGLPALLAIIGDEGRAKFLLDGPAPAEEEAMCGTGSRSP